MSKAKQTSVIEDTFSWIGETIGQTVELVATSVGDVVVGVVYDLPVAVVKGFETGFSFQSDEPKANDAVIDASEAPQEQTEAITKSEYAEKLQAELERVNASIDAETKSPL